MKNSDVIRKANGQAVTNVKQAIGDVSGVVTVCLIEGYSATRIVPIHDVAACEWRGNKVIVSVGDISEML